MYELEGGLVDSDGVVFTGRFWFYGYRLFGSFHHQKIYFDGVSPALRLHLPDYPETDAQSLLQSFLERD